jgi:hypothetical protein
MIKLMHDHKRPLFALALTAASLCCIFALSAFTYAPDRSARATISPTDCHSDAYSHPVQDQSINVPYGGITLTIRFQLRWCRDYQSHYGRFINNTSTTLFGGCYLSGTLPDGSVVSVAQGCDQGIPAHGSVDTQLYYSPTGSWSACIGTIYGTKCTTPV